MRKLRQHQVEMDRLASDIINGVISKRSITLDCTPGGGKTGSACLLATKMLNAGVIDRVLWLVPRLSLERQVREAFADWDRECGRHLERPGRLNDIFAPSLPGAPRIVGCVATYQTVASRKNWERFRDAVARWRTLLICDEIQFLNDSVKEKGWRRYCGQVEKAARMSLLMTGTLWRSDGYRIPFVEYRRGADQIIRPVPDISYPLRAAVREGAVLPTEWHNLGGVVHFKHNDVEHILDTLDDNGQENARVVRTFLRCEDTVHKLLDIAVEHWRTWRNDCYESRMLVMADTIKDAEKWRNYLSNHHGIPCVLATSDAASASRDLEAFRLKKCGLCLVTVGMAYVGFDCPDITHTVYLSRVRAKSYLAQASARGSRFDPMARIEYRYQHAFMFGPDDEALRRFAIENRLQTETGIRDRPEREGIGGGGAFSPLDTFKPLGADPGAIAVESLARRLSPADVAMVEDFIRRCPRAASTPRSVLFEILQQAKWGQQSGKVG
ncbi:MAG: hypothetical protein E6Q97_08580 [Desulfurellales bacterium]|nr:MAG: hypothetical protein E6Q97_08580 [Desulfurellales bacterium]